MARLPSTRAGDMGAGWLCIKKWSTDQTCVVVGRKSYVCTGCPRDRTRGLCCSIHLNLPSTGWAVRPLPPTPLAGASTHLVGL
jgi:hypothetical protein